MNLKEKLKLWKRQLIFALIQPEINEPFRKRDFIVKSEYKRQVKCVMPKIIRDTGLMLYDTYAEKKICRNYLLERIQVNLLYLRRVNIYDRKFEESVSMHSTDNQKPLMYSSEDVSENEGVSAFESRRRIMENTIRENGLNTPDKIRNLILRNDIINVNATDSILDKAVHDTLQCLAYFLDVADETELNERFKSLQQHSPRQIPFLLCSSRPL